MSDFGTNGLLSTPSGARHLGEMLITTGLSPSMSTVDYVGHRAETKKTTYKWLEGSVHARAVLGGVVSPWSRCGYICGEKAIGKSVPGAAQWAGESLGRWDEVTNQRCQACERAVESSFDEGTLWGRSSGEKTRCCIVCRMQMRFGPRALLYRQERHGGVPSTSTITVTVHKECLATGRVLAQQQGCRLQHPPGPEWDPQSTWRPPEPPA
jgi:hypothetical protein